MVDVKLINCPACNKEISVETSSCPGCGQPITEKVRNECVKRVEQHVEGLRKSKSRTRKVWGFIFLCFFALYMVGLQKEDKPYDFADKYRRDASFKCSKAIESYAKYDYHWKSFGTEIIPRFPYASYVTPGDNTVIRFRGKDNDLSFKNAFGVMVPMTYSCDYDTKTKTVIDVMVKER